MQSDDVLLGKSYKGINLHRLLALGFSSFRHLASNLKGFECLHDVVHFVGLRAKVGRNVCKCR